MADDCGAAMDLGKVMDGGGRGSMMPATPDVRTMRDSAHTPSTRTLEASRSSTMLGSYDVRSQSELWAGALSRMQTQISLNTSMLESHRRQVAEIEQAVGRLHADMGNVMAALNEVRAELHGRPAHVDQPRHDTGDLDLLASQVASVTSKANEVDGLRMQLDLLKNRLKRFEEQGSPLASMQRPGTSSTHRELYEVTPVPQQHPAVHPPLPPMRAQTAMSPPSERQHVVPAPPILPSQPPSSFPAPGPRMSPSEQSSLQSVAPGFRAAELLPPPSALSGWRPAESHPASSVPPPPRLSQPFRPHGMQPESQSSGWAAVNLHHHAKRPFEEQHRSPYGPPSAPGSPKRPKLAPIMPRGSHGDESYVPTPSSMQQTVTTNTSDGSFQPRSRAPSDPSHSQPHGLPTPASANTSSYRFITSTQQADSQESWRPESERVQLLQQPVPPAGRGKGRNRGGRGKGRGGRGGVHQQHDVEELGNPTWERESWTGSQISPNGYYNPIQPQRSGLISGAGSVVSGPPDHEHEYPATPEHGHPGSHAIEVEIADSGSNKKSRTKPIRNAEGVLIRKDGRPDMRSVSSANNLRKVHAKKEAERAEAEGRTPTSSRSIAPANSTSLSEEEERAHSGYSAGSGTPASIGNADGDKQDTQDRHHELMSRILPHGVEGAGSRYFPRREEPTSAASETAVKMEEAGHEAENPGAEGASDTQMTDPIMREMSDAQAEERAAERQHHLSTAMPTQTQPEGDAAIQNEAQICERGTAAAV